MKNKCKYSKNTTSIAKFFFFSLLVLVISISCEEDDLNTNNSNCEQQVFIDDAYTPFSENFDSYDTFTTPSFYWTSVNEEGIREFIVMSHQGNNFIEMTSFNSNENTKTWLISPKLDFDTMIDKNMSFNLAAALENGNPLKVMFSNNYNGSDCPSTFTWVEIGTSIVGDLINNTENDDFNFEPTGDIDISALTGSGVIAFVYQGADNGILTKIQIDDVRIGQSIAFIPVLSISGTLEVGDILTANYSPLIDAAGNTVSVNYQWYRANDASGSNEVLISGATNETYELVNPDSGKYITVKTTVNGVVTTTEYVGVVTGINTPPTAAVIVTGTSTEPGEILTADTSASFDIDDDPLTFTYQWYRASTISAADEEVLTGETNINYTITDIDLGKYISVKVIANDGTFNSPEATATYIFIPHSNQVFINELADPNNATRGRFVELYNDGNSNIDLAGWKLIRYTNDGTTASTEEHLLIGIINANSTFVIGKVSDASTTTDDFESIFGFPPDQAADPHSNGTINMVVTPIDSNGDDQILLIAPDGSIKDIFGVIGEDGSGTAHEFEDGKAVRKLSVTQSNPVWTSTEWDVWNDTGANGTTNDPQDAPANFTPGIR